MEVIILCGGYATRLRPLSEYIPKPLFPLGGVPLLNYIIEKVEEIKPERIIISTNKRFENHFKYWINTLDKDLIQKIELIVEPSKNEEEKLGAIAGLNYTIKEAWIEDDLLVIAGDNLFDFDLRKMKRILKEKRKIVIALYKVDDISKIVKKYGNVLIDDNGKIIYFEEKPEYPKSNIISTGIYAFPYEKLNLIDEFLKETKYTDALGRFFEWLIHKDEVYGYVFEGIWFDIGTFEEYQKANEYVLKTGWYRKWV